MNRIYHDFIVNPAIKYTMYTCFYLCDVRLGFKECYLHLKIGFLIITSSWGLHMWVYLDLLTPTLLRCVYFQNKLFRILYSWNADVVTWLMDKILLEVR